MSDVNLIYEQSVCNINPPKRSDVVLDFNNNSGCCDSTPVDLAQQVMIEQNRKEILTLTQNIKETKEHLESRIREKIITGSTLDEEQEVGDYYILQGDTIRKVTKERTVMRAAVKATKGENETCLKLTIRQ